MIVACPAVNAFTIPFQLSDSPFPAVQIIAPLSSMLKVEQGPTVREIAGQIVSSMQLGHWA